MNDKEDMINTRMRQRILIRLGRNGIAYYYLASQEPILSVLCQVSLISFYDARNGELQTFF